jgi:hypothetical protein
MKMYRHKDIFAIGLALLAASVAAGQWLLHFAYQGSSFNKAIIETVLVFFLSAGFILLVYYSGGRRWKNSDIVVSPWFAVFFCGSLFLFWTGGIFADNLYYGGMIVVALWGAAIFSIWGILRLLRIKKLNQLLKRDTAKSRSIS